jgi:hypothetical protein
VVNIHYIIVFVFFGLSIVHVVVSPSIHRHIDLLGVLGLLHVQWLIIVKHISSAAKWWVLANADWDRLDGILVDQTFLGVEYLGNVVLYLLSFGLDVLNCKRNDGSSDLDSHGVVGLQSKLIFE